MLATIDSGSKKDTPQRVQFGNFDIINDAEGRPLALGKGTFGRTYQARHRFLDTIVALKIINERYAADAGVRQRFLVEARAVARLSHPHIARLYDFGEVDGQLHYAMEYCGGGSLADYVAKNGALETGQVVEVGQQIAGALKCAHGAGFIHRDLKPSNIMLTETKGPVFSKLIDFGLVQPSLPEATNSDQSADGARFLGTPLFASPEQLKEEPMDTRTDLFSLGMTLWYLLLGRAPDGGSSAEIAARRLSPESYVTQLSADLPSQLRDVLARLLQKDRKNRFASAAEALAAFNACATALGLRRARDYTSATDGTELEEVEVSPAPQPVARVAPAEIEQVEADLDSEFKIVTRVNDDITGANFVAESKADSGALVFLHVLHGALSEDASTFELFRTHMTQLRALDARELLQPRALRAYSDYVSVVIEKPEGGDLLSILRSERVVHLAEAAPLLESIATVCDRLTAAGLPGPQLAPAYIFVEWPDGKQPSGGANGHQLSQARPKLFPRFLAVSEAPELARLSEPEDASSTMTSDMLGDPSRADNVCEHFGTLLYRIVAGRNCPIAASLSSQAYVAVPGLSEQANRLLALVIAKQIERASCGQVLREILAAEGIAPRSHPSTAFGVSSSGSTVVPPGATPPVSLRTPPTSATGSTVSSSRFRPMPVAPSTPPPPLIIPPPREREPAEAMGDLRAKVEAPPPIELKPLTASREATPAAPIATPDPAPKPAAEKSRPMVAKSQPGDAGAKEAKTVTEPATTAATPAPEEAVTVVEKKAVAPASPPRPPRMTSAPTWVTPKPNAVQDIVPWLVKNVRPIGIGIAALLVVSLAYGITQKVRSRSGATPNSVTLNEPATQPAQDIVPTTAANPPAAVTEVGPDKNEAARLAERERHEKEATDAARLAAQKAADDAKLLADQQQKVNQPDQNKQVPETEAAPVIPNPEAPKTRVTQKPAQKDTQSSRNSANTRTSQSSSRPAPVAPAPRPPPPQRPANNPRPRSEFGPSAPGG
jgi:hypothetical protein